jgi:hypothetical protein
MVNQQKGKTVSEKSAKGWLAGDSFAERLTALKGDTSFHELARQMQKAGIKVTAQGLHKWVNGGGISAENLKDVARYFKVSPAHLYFGELGETEDQLTPDARLVAKAWMLVPERFRPDLTRDLLRIASAYADKEDKALQFSLKKMLDEL